MRGLLTEQIISFSLKHPPKRDVRDSVFSFNLGPVTHGRVSTHSQSCTATPSTPSSCEALRENASRPPLPVTQHMPDRRFRNIDFPVLISVFQIQRSH